MTLMEMIEDYCRRTKCHRTPEEIAFVAYRNHVIATEDGFVVFSWVLDEFHCLFAYAAPGHKFVRINAILEDLARDKGIKRIKFSTDRPKTMGRLFRGYKPIATILGKEMN